VQADPSGTLRTLEPEKLGAPEKGEGAQERIPAAPLAALQLHGTQAFLIQRSCVCVGPLVARKEVQQQR